MRNDTSNGTGIMRRPKSPYGERHLIGEIDEEEASRIMERLSGHSGDGSSKKRSPLHAPYIVIHSPE